MARILIGKKNRVNHLNTPIPQTTSLDETLASVASERWVWLRLAAGVDKETGWQTRMLEATSGDAPPMWEDRRWEYPGALFVALSTPGQTTVTGSAGC